MDFDLRIYARTTRAYEAYCHEIRKDQDGLFHLFENGTWVDGDFETLVLAIEDSRTRYWEKDKKRDKYRLAAITLNNFISAGKVSPQNYSRLMLYINNKIAE